MPPTIDLTQYTDTAGVAFPGMLYDLTLSRKRSYQNGEASAAVPPGLMVARNSELLAKLLVAATDALAGVVIHTHARNNVSGQNGFESGAEMGVLEEGAVYVQCEQTVTVADPVYVRVAAGTGTVIGAFRKDSDNGTAVLVAGARFIAGGGVTNPPAVYFSAAVQAAASDDVEIAYAFAQTAATKTYKVMKTRADRHFVIDEVWIEDITGLAVDVANYFVIALKQGATTMSSISTHDNALTADTLVQLTNGTLATRTVPPGTEVDLVATLTGTQTLPAGTLNVKGHYI